ncbi:DNA polymerase ligase N-terminal domain-containing protein [Tautonia plasticadhaerens]|uniref:DNA ligase-like protein n=1 Tax=Tautonia plasticadhaerens TaxID=2527974 RepID=A0A518GXJ6_9BACT|nr:DNA polymerase ligase N-terminal domain-containing protein [Tautonia plasticadhaerens]QDV33318.1 Putative DNA ligase-like protein [Tautonia plasticadhaerens]
MTATPGPSGRFVLLEHRWDGIHWDLMLEAGASLRTWALGSFPGAGVDIDARALPDHRPLYLEYEGPISGGRGVVRRVDSGTYERVAWEPDRVVVRLRGAQVIGEVELVRVGGDRRWGWRLRIGKFI